ncbi:uncharacterized protein MYCFIDRAFT_55082 [Pseudocercospora fijiensis CIRAD86]|uniref:Mitochondrial division protein 1 n=1 Tax=Pseudocercospora fijiensis (strain CIRAD86) TaxID=383855 RepID=N1QAP7_PSEFD|nr:uncharacterized protein MYCFIDRAFT_55082 [Pseudocercospora fijiensis CIRAD86]EME88072.1 hypothetical protein MYCFIDRAFT_55082 [Pseudocercospora fijiensis CIRAD86]
MPATDSPAVIVARYLKSNNYTETYEAFINEVGLPYDAGNVSKGDLTIETLLEEKKTFDVSIRFEKLGVEDANVGWSRPAPSTATQIDVLPTASNILSTQVENVAEQGQKAAPVLLVSTADRKVHILDAWSNALQRTLANLHDSPVLSCSTVKGQHLLTSSMSGSLHLNDTNGSSISKRRDHSKYVVKVAVLEDSTTGTIVATAGWDNAIFIYKPQDTNGAIELGEPKATIPLQTKPEAMIWLRHPENQQPVLLVSRTDSNNIFFYTAEDPPRLLGKQNLAPHSNAWVAFTPSSLELCPTDPTLLAVGTSSVPHMKLLIVRLLFPPWEPEPARRPPQALRSSLLDDNPVQETQASQARAALAVADREHAAIQIHCTTMAPQTAYSTPAVMWRPDGSGVWVNGDDGAVRGIEACSGKVVATLLGHEPGSKVRCLWAGMVKSEEGQKEILVSGGFDQKLIVWNV